MKLAESYKIGLALSGGAARGMAHLGVVKALYEHGIYPGIISGTSSGAIAGAFLADGYSPDELCKIFLEKKIFEFVNISLRKQGLLKAAGLKALIRSHLRAKTFEKLKMPLYISVTNMNSGKVEYINKGALLDVIIASSSIPVIFTPVTINHQLYSDGGILDNFPIKPIKGMCEKLIGVHVNFAGEMDEISGLKMITERAFRLSIGRGITEMGRECDLFIEPTRLAKFGLMDLGKGKEMFDIGYEAARELLEDFEPVKDEGMWTGLLNKVKKTIK